MALRRVVLFLLLLVTLAASTLALYEHAARPARAKAPDAAERALARLQLHAAAQALAELYRMTGTYEDADLHVIRRLHIVRATETAYCIQVVEGDGLLFHLEGPRGHIARGACPRY